MMRNALAASCLCATLASAALGGVAWAADPAPVATSPVGADAPPSIAPPPATGDTTAGQISAWIHTNDDGSVQEGNSNEPPPPRAIHGEVGVAAGSNGYSSEHGVADIPVGRTGDLVVGASNTEGHFRHGGSAQSQSLSVGLFLDGASPANPPCGSPQDRRGPGFGPEIGPGYPPGAGMGPGYAANCQAPPAR